jgi:hypothetical protein
MAPVVMPKTTPKPKIKTNNNEDHLFLITIPPLKNFIYRAKLPEKMVLYNRKIAMSQEPFLISPGLNSPQLAAIKVI